MGPQLYRCGNRALCSPFLGGASVASMGPQLYRCGNLPLLQAQRINQVASMGPQLYRCGNSAARLNQGAGPVALQWGRNFIVAETRRSATVATRDKMASMGPQLYRCGNLLLFRAVAPWLSCFNGAATLSLRKQVRGRQQSRKKGRVLQWGRNFIVAETRCMALCQSNRSGRFNGAATLSLRKRHLGADNRFRL